MARKNTITKAAARDLMSLTLIDLLGVSYDLKKIIITAQSKRGTLEALPPEVLEMLEKDTKTLNACLFDKLETLQDYIIKK